MEDPVFDLTLQKVTFPTREDFIRSFYTELFSGQEDTLTSKDTDEKCKFGKDRKMKYLKSRKLAIVRAY